MKFALVGYGKWGQKVAAKLSKTSRLTAITANNNSALRDKLRQNQICTSVKNLDEILQDPDIESVFIATTIEKLYEIARKSLFFGKNVFLEKPGACQSEEMEDLINLASDKNLAFCVNYIYAADPAFEEFRRLVSTIQKPVSLSAVWKKEGSSSSPVLFNLASHFVYMLLEIFPEEHLKIDLLDLKQDKIDISISSDNFQFSILCHDKCDEESCHYIKCDQENLVWSPRFVRRADSVIFSCETDLLEAQLQNFEKINHQNNELHLKKCLDVSKILERIEGFVA